ncbi:MAG TPA: prenyltransferase/squalene oxidase repeat-containing protein [Gemmataceae bacterium]|nr:prenyltransferase/squalene oxidase repeat-containing protein [Gemmataceae bacterium]
MLTPARFAIVASWVTAATCFVSAVHGGDQPGEPTAKDIQPLIDKGLVFLKTQQAADGSFSAKRAGPGITAVVVAGLLRCGHSPKEPAIAKAIEYLEKSVQKDGGIYDKALANYTTSVAVMALKEGNKDGKYDSILKNAGNFLKGLQHEEGTTDLSKLNAGGFGYDKGSRPDMSNSAFTVEALLAAGLTKDDPAVKKALEFLSKCQNLPSEQNKQPFATKATADDLGGFTYVPDPKDSQYATPGGGLRSLGGMTYGGLKSFLYAGVDKEDTRVKAAIAWIRKHYTVEENPGMGQSGLYYYYHTFAKAMDALGENPFADAAGKKHFWKRELFDALVKRQQPAGSWRNAADKAFGETDPNLATGFALLSLSYCQAKK